MVNAIYVSTSKPLIFKEFEKFKAPMGWFRIDILKRRLKESQTLRSKFSKEEIKKIMET